MIHSLLATFLIVATHSAEPATDPIGVLELRSDFPVSLYRSPSDSRPAKSAKPLEMGFATLEIAGYRGEGESANEQSYLVWRWNSSSSRPRFLLRSKDASYWVQAQDMKGFKLIKSALSGSPHIVLKRSRWDGKLSDAPGSKKTRDIPPRSRSLPDISFIELPAPTCRDTGTVTDKAGGEWTTGSCDPGKPVPLFESPDGPPIQMSDRGGSSHAFEPLETHISAAVIHYQKAHGRGAPVRLILFERRDGWVKARMYPYAPYNDRWAWLRTSAGTVGSFVSDEEKRKVISETTGLREALGLPEERESEPEADYSARIHAVKESGGRVWIEISVYTQDLCHGDEAKPDARGWVTLMDTPLEARFTETTCD
ncbi:MAG TPA: hypothetical protein VM598_08670 [Bdellovibrionota bacterium]|nr:hypothetical protein [Bdellovibrionota bacterium]